MSISGDDDNDSEFYNNISVFTTDQLFGSVDELKTWAQTTGRENGVVIVTERSKSNVVGEVVKIYLRCDHGGEYKCTAKTRRTGTNKTGCRFQLIGKYLKNYNRWSLVVSRDTHNHELAAHMEGHPYAMRFTSDEKVVVADMYQNRTTPRDTLSNLKAKDNKNSSSLRTVYNERKKLREKERGGESPMNVLFNQLIVKKFIHHDRTNPATNALEDLFFIHPTSYMIYRAFPHVLIIDTTYNTNVYKLPLVQIVGVTSTGKTFTIALAFISHEKEDNFTWVLTMLKTTLDTCMLPRVIVTDRDLALMKACQIVFPDAAKLLCRFHISRNILKNCRQSFALIEEWELFEQLWNSLIHSATPTKYEKRYTKLYDTLVHSHQRVLQYLHKTWLDTHKEKFVSVWIDQNLHFGNTTTNRVEGAHALLKKHLLTHNSSIDKFVDVVDRIVTRQQGAIRETFEQSSKKTMNHHNIPLFNELRRHVAHDALELLCEELVRIDRLQQYGSECGCRIRTSCGLPCVCILSKYLNSGQAIPCAIDWNMLRLVGEYDRAEGIIGVGTPWRRLIDQASEPCYRELTLEFLSTFHFTSPIEDIHEADSVQFCLLGQHRPMTLPQFAVLCGLYTESEVQTDMFLQGGINMDEVTLKEFWRQIGSGEFDVKMRTSSIVDPLHRYLHKIIATSISARHGSKEWCTQGDLFYMHSLLRHVNCNLAWCLANYFSTLLSKKIKGKIVCGAFVTVIAQRLGGLTNNVTDGMKIYTARKLGEGTVKNMGIARTFPEGLRFSVQEGVIWDPHNPPPLQEEHLDEHAQQPPQPQQRQHRHVVRVERVPHQLTQDFEHLKRRIELMVDMQERYHGWQAELARTHGFVVPDLTQPQPDSGQPHPPPLG